MAITTPASFSSGVPQALQTRLAHLNPLRGLCYQPIPSDARGVLGQPGSKYFDSDFTNSSFPDLWGGTRKDLQNFANTLGVNFLHLYDWSVPPTPGGSPGPYERDHLPFLAEAANQGIRVTIPVSNYFIGEIQNGNGAMVKTQIAAMVAEAYDGGTTPHPGAGLIMLANEYDLSNLSAASVATAFAYVIDAENALGVAASDRLPVSSPVSFGTFGQPNEPGVVKTRELLTAFGANSTVASAWQDRFIASVNPFNDGTFLTTYLSTTWPAAFPDLPLIFAEMGASDANTGGPSGQAAFVAGQLQAVETAIASGTNFLGACVFQSQDQSAAKSGSEAQFGLRQYSGSLGTGTIQPPGYTPGGGDSYPIDDFAIKPSWQSVITAYT